MSKYYHGTSYDNLLKIIEDGEIKTSAEGIVYLAETKEDAFRFVVFRHIHEDIVVIELELDDSKIEETFDHNPIILKCKAFGHDGPISTKLATNYWKFEAKERFKDENYIDD